MRSNIIILHLILYKFLDIQSLLKDVRFFESFSRLNKTGFKNLLKSFIKILTYLFYIKELKMLLCGGSNDSGGKHQKYF